MTTESRDAHTEANINPGLKFFVWRKAYTSAAWRVIDNVFEEGALNNACKAHIQSNDVQVTQLVKPTLRTGIIGSRLIWMLENASVTVRGQRRDQNGEETFEKRISGTLEIKINVVRAGPFFDPIYSAKVNCDNVSFSSSSHGNGSKVLDVDNGNSSSSVIVSNSSGSKKRTSSEVVVNDVNLIIGNSLSSSSTKRSKNDVTITGGNYSIKFTGSASDSDLGKTLVSVLVNAVLESLNDHLPDYSFPIGSSCDWMFDFSGLARPRFQNGYLGATHLGAFQYSDIPILMPVQAPLFPEPQSPDRMLTIFISNYVFNTIGYCFHEYSILNYNLTQADLIAQATQDNSAINTSGRTRCLSDCFPDFSVKYPGASVEVIMASTESPTSTFSGLSLKVTLLGSAHFYAHIPDGSLVNFLTTEVCMETTVQLKLKLDKLMGTVTSIMPKSITVVESTLESVNREVLKEAFELIATQFLRRKFEEVTENGIPLPRPLLPRVEEFQNSVISTTDDLLRIDTDLKFHK